MMDLTLSVVSHGQSNLVDKLLQSLQVIGFKGTVIYTKNLPENLNLNSFSFKIITIENEIERGFGYNHNNAFTFCNTSFFAVVNPDIQFTTPIFEGLISSLSDPNIGVITSASFNLQGVLQDNARKFPRLYHLILKIFGIKHQIKYELNQGVLEVDWVSGQFMLFKSKTFEMIEGFSDKYFMYYEDVDLCRRLKNSGLKTVLNTNYSLIHDARRNSRRSIKLFLIHLKSALTYYFNR